MSIRNFVTAAIAVPLCLCPCMACSAQINLAALAQFKYNQQQALAQSLQKSQPTTSKSGRGGKHGSKTANAQATPANIRPAYIPANNQVFKTKFQDLRRNNVR